MYDWVKKLGQWHKSNGGSTLCGKPMLGSNYAMDIPVEERDPCPDCMDAMGFTHSLTDINEAFGLN